MQIVNLPRIGSLEKILSIIIISNPIIPYIYADTHQRRHTAILWYISMSYKYWTKVFRFKICFHPAPTNVIMKFWCIFKKTYVMSEKKIKQSKEPSRRYTKELFSSFSVWLMFMVACTVPIFCLSKTLGYCFISNFREWFEKCMNRKKEVAACYTHAIWT